MFQSLFLFFNLTLPLQNTNLSASLLVELSTDVVTKTDVYLQKSGFRFLEQSNPDGAGYDFFYHYDNGKGITFDVVTSGGAISQFIITFNFEDQALKLLEDFKKQGYVFDQKVGEDDLYFYKTNDLTYKLIHTKAGILFNLTLDFNAEE